MNIYIDRSDREILRAEARHQQELAHMERNEKLIQMWYDHNELQGERPMIHLEM